MSQSLSKFCLHNKKLPRLPFCINNTFQTKFWHFRPKNRLFRLFFGLRPSQAEIPENGHFWRKIHVRQTIHQSVLWFGIWKLYGKVAEVMYFQPIYTLIHVAASQKAVQPPKDSRKCSFSPYSPHRGKSDQNRVKNVFWKIFFRPKKSYFRTSNQNFVLRVPPFHDLNFSNPKRIPWVDSW